MTPPRALWVLNAVAICDMFSGMSTLSEHIKGQPEKTMSEWAGRFGVSRPYLYQLVDGTRYPSLPVAMRIAKATNGAVPITAWPNLAAVVDAAKPRRRA